MPAVNLIVYDVGIHHCVLLCGCVSVFVAIFLLLLVVPSYGLCLIVLEFLIEAQESTFCLTGRFQGIE